LHHVTIITTNITNKIQRVMKTINKSAVMTRGWNIYRGKYHYSNSFAACLRRAWEVEKENIAYRAKQVAQREEKARLQAYHNSDEYKVISNSPSNMTHMEAAL
jgi:hypothetical protein